ncbi:MAG: hypothetical protein H7843_16405, partial [Nitrospirota bacterium]
HNRGNLTGRNTVIKWYNLDIVPAGKIASVVEKSIGADAEPFTLFDRFPKFGKVVATQFIKENYRGLDFVHDALEREYELDGENVTVCLIHQPEKTLAAYLNFFKTSNTKYSVDERGGKQLYKVDDKYEGQWVLIPLEDTLIGVFGKLSDDKLMEIISLNPQLR